MPAPLSRQTLSARALSEKEGAKFRDDLLKSQRRKSMIPLKRGKIRAQQLELQRRGLNELKALGLKGGGKVTKSIDGKAIRGLTRGSRRK
tara:strand:+ start:226 stop:495 length:270 start_codon:yes stop_codon:yes gene_type:complete